MTHHIERKWYLAELLQEFHVANEETESLWINWILVNAAVAEEAYTKALKFGHDLNEEFYNPDGRLITSTFRGLRNLTEIYEDFADGSEIAYEKIDEITREDIERMAKPKEKLAVFRPANSESSVI